jgi:hypothetical protein
MQCPIVLLVKDLFIFDLKLLRERERKVVGGGY